MSSTGTEATSSCPRTVSGRRQLEGCFPVAVRTGGLPPGRGFGFARETSFSLRTTVNPFILHPIARQWSEQAEGLQSNNPNSKETKTNKRNSRLIQLNTIQFLQALHPHIRSMTKFVRLRYHNQEPQTGLRHSHCEFSRSRMVWSTNSLVFLGMLSFSSLPDVCTQLVSKGSNLARRRRIFTCRPPAVGSDVRSGH